MSPTGKVRDMRRTGSGSTRNRGYPKFTFTYQGRKYSLACHQFGAWIRYGHTILGWEIRHADGDKQNFDPSNLLPGTRSQNEQDKCPKKRSEIARKAAKARWERRDVEQVPLFI